MWLDQKLILFVIFTLAKCDEIIEVKRYSVILYSDIHDGNLAFSGDAVITLDIKQDLESIKLYHEGLNIKNVIVKNVSGEISTELKNNQENYSLIEIKSGENFKRESGYNLSVTFEGKFPNEFLGSYFDDDTKVYFLAVNFKSKPFQIIFPSTEGDYHINFQLYMNSTYNAVSNGLVKGTPNPSLTIFEELENIKTSSIAFFVSDFESISKANVTLYAIKSHINYFNEALEIATQIIKNFETLFDYQLGNISLIAVPGILINDVSTHKLILFDQFNIFYHENLSSNEHKEKISHLMAFAIAQQFFGNIITTASQSDSFITEGLASFYEHFILSQNSVEHENHIMELFNVEILQKAFEIDSGLLSSEPLMTSKLIPADEFNLFSRYKASSIMRMMESVLGNENFTKGVKYLLSEHKNKSIQLQDFYDALQNEINFDSWMTQKGYPLISVEILSENRIQVRQERFNLNNSEALWNIPLTYLSAESDEVKIIWLNESAMTLEIPTDGWILFNVESKGYYRVNYDETLWNRLINELKTENIPITNRAAIINDAFSFALAETISYKRAFEVLSYLINENDLIPWKAAHEELKFLDAMLFKSKIHPKFKNFVIELIEPHLKILTSENYNLKSIILFWTCQMEMEECQLKNLIPENFTSLHPNERKMMICNAVKFIDETLFNETISLMISMEGDKSDLISGLTCAENSSWLRFLLLLPFDENSNLSQSDKRQIFIEVLKNHKYGSMAGTLLIDEKSLVLSDGEILFALEEIVKRFWNNNSLVDFEHLGLDHIENYQTYINLAKDRLEWLKMNSEEIENFLDSLHETTTAISTETETEMTSEETTAGRTSLITINSPIIVLMIYGVINV